MSLFDTFPPRNLSPESSEWGREVEARILGLSSDNQTGMQSLNGLNRSTSAILEELAKQLRDLAAQVERINQAYAALPSPVQGLASPTNFGVPGSGTWNTIATVSIVAPKTGVLRLSATGTGMLRSPSTSTNMEATARLLFESSASAEIPGNFESPDGTWRNSFFVPWGWTANVTQGQTYNVRLQVNPVDAASWPAGNQSYAVLSVTGAVAA